MFLRFAGVLAGATGLAACTAGSGSLVTYSPGGRDDPGATRDTPPSTRDNPTGACIVCDVNYDCSGGSTGEIGGGGIMLGTSEGTCVQSLIDVVCSGALFNASGCSGGGGGPFTCGDTTCSPARPSVTVTSPGSGGVIGTLPPNATPVSAGTTGSGPLTPDAG